MINEQVFRKTGIDDFPPVEGEIMYGLEGFPFSWSRRGCGRAGWSGSRSEAEAFEPLFGALRGVPAEGVARDRRAGWRVGESLPQQINGEEQNAMTGLQYLRARYYEPDNGRFTSKDTYFGELRSPLTLNAYIYVGNDPLNRIDPSGHAWADTQRQDREAAQKAKEAREAAERAAADALREQWLQTQKSEREQAQRAREAREAASKKPANPTNTSASEAEKNARVLREKLNKKYCVGDAPKVGSTSASEAYKKGVTELNRIADKEANITALRKSIIRKAKDRIGEYTGIDQCAWFVNDVFEKAGHPIPVIETNEAGTKLQEKSGYATSSWAPSFQSFTGQGGFIFRPAGSGYGVVNKSGV